MSHVFDTSVIIKGLIKPRRKKQDSISKEQLRIYNLASSLVDKVNNREIEVIIPVVAVIEVACVSSRLTGSKNVGRQTAEFVINFASNIISDTEILQECIDIGSVTMSSGFDTVFITCAKVTNSILITDDKKMFNAAIKVGVKAELLRNMGI